MLKAAGEILVFDLVLALLMFIPAGDLAWAPGWLFMALFDGGCLAIGLWLARTDPDLLAERLRSPLSARQRPRDRWIIIAIGLAFCAWIAFMALDARRPHPSPAAPWMQALGAMLIAAAFLAWTWVLSVNRFAATTVRLQADRGQSVISTGPYALVRHPMYAGGLGLLIGTPLLLGSPWGLCGLAVFLPLLGLRALGEEALLLDGLPGYRAYADKVRFRLVPGVW